MIRFRPIRATLVTVFFCLAVASAQNGPGRIQNKDV
jgi:hypothetical protein